MLYCNQIPKRDETMTIDLERKKKLKKELQRIIETLRSEYRPEKIILFGSLVSGQTNSWSDIDLVIIKSTEKRFLERLKEVALLTQPRVGVDFFVYTPQEFREMTKEEGVFQRSEMFQKGKVLYDNS